VPRPRSLSPAAIAAAALAVLDRGGLGALSMRAVATELGMGTMSLYRYVDDREQVERLIVEQVLDPVDLDLPAGTWTERIGVVAERLRAAVAAHPDVVPLLLAHRHESTASLRWGEAILGELTAAGFTGTGRVIAFRAVLSYLTGALGAERLGALAGPGTAAIARLARTEFPLLVETAVAAREVDVDAEFRGGLTLLLDGLALRSAGARAGQDPVEDDLGR
jgi:AcrR family transcriptional regulator